MQTKQAPADCRTSIQALLNANESVPVRLPRGHHTVQHRQHRVLTKVGQQRGGLHQPNDRLVVTQARGRVVNPHTGVGSKVPPNYCIAHSLQHGRTGRVNVTEGRPEEPWSDTGARGGNLVLRGHHGLPRGLHEQARDVRVGGGEALKAEPRGLCGLRWGAREGPTRAHAHARTHTRRSEVGGSQCMGNNHAMQHTPRTRGGPHSTAGTGQQYKHTLYTPG